MRKGLLLLISGIILLAVAGLAYFWPEKQENIDWDLTLVGSRGETRVLSYDEIIGLPCYEGRGGFFTTTGVINGPFAVRGVPVDELCELVGGVTPKDGVFISAVDGYSSVYDYEQVKGDFITYDPQTMKEAPHGELKMILIYRQDGEPLSEDCGRPLRLAVAGEDGLLTEGLYWVKWVDRIEVMSLEE